MWHFIFNQRTPEADPSRANLFTHFCLSLLLLCGALVLVGCSGGAKKHAAYQGTGSPYYPGTGPLPKGGGVWKVGKPYKIAGKTYYPKENTNYDKVGIASWYGPKFHRRQTANGEWFNMHDLTAAHPTLPMPTFAKVTNLQNGRNIIVRINDRGPYAHKREIDLSKASAIALGVIGKGTAKVRVQYLGKAPLNGHLFADMPTRDKTMLLAKANGKVHQQYADHKNQKDKKASEEDSSRNLFKRFVSSNDSTKGEKIYVQAASFSNEARAASAKLRLKTAAESLSKDNKFMIAKADINGRTWYRLRMGPFKSSAEARTALEQVQTAGHNSAMIVSD